MPTSAPISLHMRSEATAAKPRPRFRPQNRRRVLCVFPRYTHSFGTVTALGGPSASGCPEWYPHVDLLHVGELGEATDALIARLDRSVERPERQEVYTAQERLPMAEFPLPVHDHLLRDRGAGRERAEVHAQRAEPPAAHSGRRAHTQ